MATKTVPVKPSTRPIPSSKPRKNTDTPKPGPKKVQVVPQKRTPRKK